MKNNEQQITPRDDELKELFRCLQEQDKYIAPSFAMLFSQARLTGTKKTELLGQRWAMGVVPAILASIALIIILIFSNMRSGPDEDFIRLSDSYGQWLSPTSTLLIQSNWSMAQTDNQSVWQTPTDNLLKTTYQVENGF